VILNGEFEIEPAVAREWLRQPLNVNGRPNADVIRRTFNGDDFNGERPEKWVVDFGTSMTENEAAMYEKPFNHIIRFVRSYRQRRDPNGGFLVRAKNERDIWWRHARARPAMRRALANLSRYIATPMVSSYRTFGFLDASYLPDQKLVVFAKDDLTFFGIIHSRYHLAWTIRTCSWIGAGNDITYANRAVFLTFPFPEGLTPNIPAADYVGDPRAIHIADAARRLNELRESWLHPPDLVVRVPEIASGYPDRILLRDEDAAKELKKRTLTNLYNQRPTWLDNIHRELDAAVAAAYGWPADLPDDEILARLFDLNQERASFHRPRVS
jgi:type II restriction/modification system DNA methylase subunit YeeA